MLIISSLVVFTLEREVKLYGEFFVFNVISKHACCLDSCREFTSSTIIFNSLAQGLLMFHFIAGRRALSGLFFALRDLTEENSLRNARKKTSKIHLTIAYTLIASVIHCSGGQLVLKMTYSYLLYMIHMLIAHTCLL